MGSDEFTKYSVILSRKRLQEGTDHYAEVKVVGGVPDTNIIINPYRNTIDETIGSIVHEVLHVMNPLSKEKTVQKWETEIVGDLSPLERSAVLAVTFKNAVWDE